MSGNWDGKSDEATGRRDCVGKFVIGHSSIVSHDDGPAIRLGECRKLAIWTTRSQHSAVNFLTFSIPGMIGLACSTAGICI